MPESKKSLILLVEDNDDASAIYASSLRRAGHEVFVASTLAEGRAAASRRKPDLAVLDVRLPDGDGLGLLASWRRDEAMRDVPVVVVSASSVRQEVEAAILAGADVFVPKPCTGAELALYVQNALIGKPPSKNLRRR